MDDGQLRQQIKKLPPRPGIYIFKGQPNKPLYIGKALNLKNRIKHYLKTGDARLQRMILESKKLDYVETGSDIEALILESQYIKKYKPPFNIMLRDDKQYSFIVFTHEKYQKILMTHQTQGQEEVIGPFTDAGALKTTLRLLRRIFPYCTCKQLHYNYCLNYHIEKCPGFCCLKKSAANRLLQTSYNKNVGAIKNILLGKKSSVIRNLEKNMKALSAKQEFEKAMELQNKIGKLKRVFQNARIINSIDNEIMIYHNNDGVLDLIREELKLPSYPRRIECYDVAYIQGKFAVGTMAVFTNSQPDKKEYRKFKIQNRTTSQVVLFSEKSVGDTDMLREILSRRFKHPEWTHPDLILIDGGKGQLGAARAVIPKNIPIAAITKNERHIGHKIILENKKEVSFLEITIGLKNFLLQINSEAHRFAISYYRKLHRKSL